MWQFVIVTLVDSSDIWENQPDIFHKNIIVIKNPSPKKAIAVAFDCTISSHREKDIYDNLLFVFITASHRKINQKFRELEKG